MALLDFYTTWSLAIEVVLVSVALVLNHIGSAGSAALVMAAISNAITVGFVGPVVMAWGKLPGSHTMHYKFNAAAHALPMVIGTFAILAMPCSSRVGRETYPVAMGILLCVMFAYFACPTKRGSVGFSKLEEVYGVHAFALAASAIVLQYVVLSSIFVHYTCKRS